MNDPNKNADPTPEGVISRLQKRGVLRVALSYALIAWLVLQIGDVVLDPLDAPAWVMRALIVLVITGFPVALLLAWFLELGPTGITLDQLPESATRPSVTGLRRYADAIIITLLVGVIAVLLVRQEGLLQPEPETPVLAVLPFHEIGKSESGYFGAGLADTLSGKLGELSQLVVLASSSTLEFRGADLDIAEVGAKLGATALLLGSVQRAGGLLRVNTRLVDPRSGQQLWTQSYDRDATDLFAVQDDIAHAVTRSLALVLTPQQSERLAQVPTSSLSAYEAYLRAMDGLASRDFNRITEALRYLRDAIALDPDYALAHAGLVQALFLASFYRHWDTPWEAVREEALVAADTAVALDPNLGEAWFAKALAVIGDREHERESPVETAQLVEWLEKALQLSPSNSAIMKQLAPFMGSPEDIQLLEKAARVDPRSGIIRVNIGETYASEGDIEKAEAWLISATLTSEPFFRPAFTQLVDLNITVPGRAARAARWARAAYRKSPTHWWMVWSYSIVLTELGAWDESRRILEELSRQEDPDGSVAWVRMVGGIHVSLATGDYAAGAALAEAFIREMMIPHASWPNLEGFSGNWLASFLALALHDIENDRPELALQRYLDGYSEPAVIQFSNTVGHTLSTPVMIALLYRLTGDEERANELLKALLARLDDPDFGENESLNGIGPDRFTIYALLGETDLALSALRQQLDDTWVWHWWGLKDAARFDTNYAAVVADPRFEELYDEIIQNVTEIRESFMAQPELSEEELRATGLLLTD